jgi:tRNA 2-thiouridine synthesizing protein A
MLPYDQQLDTSELTCPLPILKAKQALKTMQPGEVLRVISTDPSSLTDFRAFAKQTGHELIDSQTLEEKYVFWVRKKR